MKLNEMTPEHLGDIATEDDLREFRDYVEALMDRDGLAEEDAVAAVWGDGDYYSNAISLGLTEF
jgi:predicted phosphodiesterase